MNEILKSKSFKDVPLRSALLRHLFKHRNRQVGGKEIWYEALKQPAKQPWDDTRVRERCLNLRKALKDYFEDGATGLVCALPAAESGKGYQLKFYNRAATESATNLFWCPHLDPQQKIVVYFDELLFYVDRRKSMGFRFFDLDAETQSVALAELKATRPEMYNDDLRVVYVAANSITSPQERIEDWFNERTLVSVDKRPCRNLDGDRIAEVSPIIVSGLTRCELARDIFKASPYLDFTMSGGERGFASVTVRSAGKTKVLTDDPDGDVFVVVTRIPHLFGSGCMTLINSEHNATAEHALATLTDDERLASVFTQAGWRTDKPLPLAFQLLFTVERGRVRKESGVANLRFRDSRVYADPI